MSVTGGRNLEVNRASFEPAYHQLREIIRRQIASGELRLGDRIPPENELAQRYQLSRMTVRRALEDLVEAGILVPKRGLGTFVARRLVDAGTVRIDDFSEEMRRRGIPAECKLLGVRIMPADGNVATRLRIDAGSAVMLLLRLLLVEGEPVGIDRKYLLYDRSSRILESELEHPSLPDLVERETSGLLGRASITVKACSASQEDAGYLGCAAGEPVLVVEQTLYLSDGRSAGYGKTVYRGDKHYLTAEIDPLGIRDRDGGQAEMAGILQRRG
ncbi:MAG: GntR family transcriptional regulator [Chloroflexi bacterium]|nr:GntR family transcriptional regulator [Chloroflexota bacterium]MDA8189858.1 GntR family transcriptional regulator [Dehalococcoidales bacterium]